VEEHPDSLTIHGVETLHGGTVDSHNDHRIAMMAAIAATAATGPVTITDAGSVAKSYPNFWEDYEALGGQISRSQEGNP
jgi:3-phosphoshikimate 1-carboxyvinyltransferase